MDDRQVRCAESNTGLPIVDAICFEVHRTIHLFSLISSGYFIENYSEDDTDKENNSTKNIDATQAENPTDARARDVTLF